MDYALIFNVLFFGIIGLAILGGLMSGFKKSLFRFVTMLIFYAVFFLTIGSVSKFLWTFEIPQLGTWLSSIDASLSTYTTIESALTPTLDVLLGVNLSSANASMEEFILGIGVFIVKLVYTVLYFTVGLVLWKIVCFILKLIFVHTDKNASKNRLFGGLVGFANGAMAVALMLIMLGGVMDVMGSIVAVIPEETPTTLADPFDRDTLYEASHSIIYLEEGEEPPLDLTEVKLMVAAYESNLIVSIANAITVTNDDAVTMPFNLYLFDEVVSFEYDDQVIFFRQELKVVATILDEVFTALDEAGIKVSEITEDDMGIILGAAASVDLTLLLDSKLISNALVFVLSGEAGLEIDQYLVIPDDIEWFDEVDAEGNVVEAGELRAILEALNAIIDAAGMVDFTNFDLNMISELESETIDTIFESTVLVATLSHLITTQDFGDTDVIIPDSAFDEDRYLKKTELVAMVEAIKLVITTTTNGDEFDFTKVLSLTPTQIDTLFESDIISATIGHYLYGMAADPLIIPSTATTTVCTDHGLVCYPVVSVTELTAVLNALALIDFTDFDTMTFDATLIEKFESTTPGILDDAKLNTLLDSQILHATLSKMLLDLTEGTEAMITIPYYNQEGEELHQTLGTVEVIDKDEIILTLKAVYSLGFDDFYELDILDPSLIFDHIDTLLDSATLHYTISDILLSFGSSVLEIPTHDYNNITTTLTFGTGSETTTYLKVSEIRAIIEGLDVLGLTDLEGFSGNIDLTVLSTETNQNRLLGSASLHYTISTTLLDLSDEVLIVPHLAEDNTTEITKLVQSYTYLSKDEIKALINGFTAMGFTNLESFGSELTSDVFFNQFGTLLNSSSIQATLSDKMLNDTAGLLVIPNDVRVTADSTIYVERTEIEAIMDGLDLIGLTNFDALTFNPATLFGTDYELLFTSETMQATVSKPILDIALDETAATGTTTLIVPNSLREAINVGLLTEEQIELDELKRLLTSLDVLGIADFASGNFDAATITTLNKADLDSMLESGSIHVTLDNMLGANGNITITEYAKTDTLYGVNDLTVADEIVSFVLAANQLTTGDFTTADFDYTTILSMTPEERTTVLHSMIVRFMITSELEDLIDLKNIAVAPAGPFFTYNAEDYVMADSTTANRVFTEEDILEIFKFLADEAFVDE